MNDFPSFNDTDKLSVLSAHIGGITLDIPQDIDQDFLTKIFKSFKECLLLVIFQARLKSISSQEKQICANLLMVYVTLFMT